MLRRLRDREWASEPPLAIWLCGLSAGIAGWMVCMVFLDGVVNFFTYMLIAFSGHVRYRLLEQERQEAREKSRPVEVPPVELPATAATARAIRQQ